MTDGSATKETALSGPKIGARLGDAPRAEDSLLTKIAEEFEKSERESIDCAAQIEKRIVGGYNFDSDREIAAHYRRNAEYFGSRGRAVREAITALRAAAGVGGAPEETK